MSITLILEFLPAVMIFACALFPPANFWVRLLIIVLAFFIHAFFILAQDKAASSFKNPTEYSRSYAENYPD